MWKMASMVERQWSPRLWYRQKQVEMPGGRVTRGTDDRQGERLIVRAWAQVPSMTRILFT